MTDLIVSEIQGLKTVVGSYSLTEYCKSIVKHPQGIPFKAQTENKIDLNQRLRIMRLILVIMYLYSDRKGKKIVHYFLNIQQIFML